MSKTPFKQVTDNAISSTQTSLLALGVTALTLPTGDGDKFPMPGNGFYLTLWNGASPGADPNMEKVLVSSRSGDVVTCGPTTKTHVSPCNVGLLDSAVNISDMQTAVNRVEGDVDLAFVLAVAL